jgi:DNA-binding transcriptional regulator/RsmH inhibitor MraZ
MSRDSGRLDALPFQTWTVQVDDQQRVRVPAELKEKVAWLRDLVATSVDCVALPGPDGGIQLQQKEAFESEAAEFLTAIGARTPTGNDAGADWASLARLFATARVVDLQLEKSQIRFKLPEAIRAARQLPEAGGSVVVFAFGNILEVWDAARFYESLQIVAKRRAALLARAIEDLANE